MRTSNILVLVAVMIAVGCAGKRHRDVTTGSAYEFEPCESCSEGCLESGTEATVGDYQVGPQNGRLGRFRPFRRRSVQVLPAGSLTCQQCNQQNNVLLNGQCIDCVKNQIDQNSIDSGDADFAQPELSRDVVSPEPYRNVTSRRKVPPAPKMKNRLEFFDDNNPANSVVESDNKPAKIKMDELDPRYSSPIEIPEKVTGSVEGFRIKGFVEEAVEAAKDEETGKMTGVPNPSDAVKHADSKVADEDSVIENETPSRKSDFVDPEFESFRLEDLFETRGETRAEERAAETDVVETPVEPNPVPNRHSTEEGVDWGKPMTRRPWNPDPDSNSQDTTQDEQEKEVEIHYNKRFDSPLKRFSTKSEKDIIREIQNLTGQRQTSFDNAPRNEQQPGGMGVRLMAKPVPHYQELRQIAEQSPQPVSLQPPMEIDRYQVPAIPASNRRRIEVGPEFDFRPLPELTPGDSLEIEMEQINTLFNDVFEPTEFPAATENNGFRPLPSPPGSISGPGDPVRFSELPSRVNSINATSIPGEVVLRAVPNRSQNEVDEGNWLGAGEDNSRAKFRFVQPNYQRERFD